MYRRAYLAGLGAAVGGLAGCTTSGSDDGDYDIGMSANAFLPDTYEVSVGESVVWRNTSSRGHTVTAYENAIPEEAAYFASGGYDDERAARDAWIDGTGGNVAQNETYEHTFEVPGEYHYVCIPHEPGGMDGVIEVVE